MAEENSGVPFQVSCPTCGEIMTVSVEVVPNESVFPPFIADSLKDSGLVDHYHFRGMIECSGCEKKVVVSVFVSAHDE